MIIDKYFGGIGGEKGRIFYQVNPKPSFSEETQNQREKKNADFRENPNRKDHHFGGREQRHRRQCQSQDPGTLSPSLFIIIVDFQLICLFICFIGRKICNLWEKIV